jgi:gamma-glutamyltranspeptidase / glutathione hydrolase
MRNFQLPGRSAAYATGGMAATSSPLATLAAVDVLRQGGNAADAAVTASAVLCITEPHMTGIGGDCFALIGQADGSVAGLNGSGRASQRADADWLKSAKLEGIASDSVHSVTVPGAIDAWDRLLKRFGTMTLADALKPAIALAEQGVPVTPRVARDWIDEEEMLAADEGGSKHLLVKGKAPHEGDIMRYPALAKTLRLIAKGGRDAFYEGPIAKDIVQHLAKRGSLLTEKDFAVTEGNWVEPIATVFAGAEIMEIPPNGQGITALIALNILQRFDLAKHAPDSVARHHLQIEAMKLAWVLRNRHIADPGFADVPVKQLLSDRMADTLAGAIDPKRALNDPVSRVPQPGSDTIYLTVVDKDRMAVSFINSIYYAFGSGIVTPNTGIALQNRGSGFVTDPRHPNCIGPGKRPFHTIIPAMARKDGRVILSFGVMGGAYQPMGHVTVALNRFVYGFDLQESLTFPRLFVDQGMVAVEAGISAEVRAGLAALGHTLAEASEPLGGGQAIAIEPSGMLQGGSDHRKDGLALGF